MALPYADALPDLAGVAGACCAKQIWLIISFWSQICAKTRAQVTGDCNFKSKIVSVDNLCQKNRVQVNRELQILSLIGGSQSVYAYFWVKMSLFPVLVNLGQRKCAGYLWMAILGWKSCFLTRICVKTMAQVTRDCDFQHKLVSAKVRRLRVIGDFRARLTADTVRKLSFLPKSALKRDQLPRTYTLR